MPIGTALRTGAAKITEVSEGGSVPTLALENLTDVPVLIIDGEELLGARQNRISNLTILAPGMKTLPLPVSCVERGRWTYRSREFAESPDLMFREARAKKSRAVSLNMARGSRASDQGAVWADIDALSSKLGYSSPTAAMQDVYHSHRSSIDEYVHEVSVADGQIGAIFAINGAGAGIELFDSTETLRTYLPKILRSYALDALANQTTAPVPAADEAEAARLLDSILELDAKSFPAIGLGDDLRLNSPSMTGGAFAQNGKVVHLAAFQTALPRRTPRTDPSSDSTRPLVIRQGHILLRGGQGRLALLDTGSPVSIGRGAAYRIAGQSWNPPTAMHAVLDAAGEHIGRPVEWLFGHDFFTANRVVIDWRARTARVAGRDDPAPVGLSIPIELVMGVPVVTGHSRSGTVRAVIDSGASLSYVPSDSPRSARLLSLQTRRKSPARRGGIVEASKSVATAGACTPRGPASQTTVMSSGAGYSSLRLINASS